ncbi:cupredoxin domain-containing protein [Candidatus Micrarchaeota archaeon]|nr:cupredoxin domain-containing protein [Candidatus Micrarchaeota archaeon]
MKMFLALLLAGSLLVFGCLGGSGSTASASPTAVASATPLPTIAVSASASSSATATATVSPSPTVSASASPSSTVSAGGVKEISLQGSTNGGSNWAWTPGTITVKKGDHVKITVTVPAGDKAHGFALPAFGVDSGAISPGESKVVEFDATQAGAFDFFCNVPCGPGHIEMKGKLIVEE